MTTIYQKIQLAKPDLSDITIKNYIPFYNIGVKHFNNPMFFKNINQTEQFIIKKYNKLNVRLTRYDAWITILLAFEEDNLAGIVKSRKMKIVNKLKSDRKKSIELSINRPEQPKKDYLKIFDEVKKKLINQAELVMDFFETDDTGYTLIELKQINKLAVMSLIANSFLQPKDQYLNALNPPRRLDYRFLKYKIGRNLSNKFNYLNKKNPKIGFYTLIYNVYKRQAKKNLGQQRLIVDKDLLKILMMYIKTHRNIRKSDILFPQNLYNEKPEKIYESYQMSRIIKKYFGYTIDDIRHAYISKAYQTDFIPDHKILEGLAYKMAHTFKTALINYRQFSKIT